jgi:hypothetical protein
VRQIEIVVKLDEGVTEYGAAEIAGEIADMLANHVVEYGGDIKEVTTEVFNIKETN